MQDLLVAFAGQGAVQIPNVAVVEDDAPSGQKSPERFRRIRLPQENQTAGFLPVSSIGVFALQVAVQHLGVGLRQFLRRAGNNQQGSILRDGNTFRGRRPVQGFDPVIVLFQAGPHRTVAVRRLGPAAGIALAMAGEEIDGFLFLAGNQQDTGNQILLQMAVFRVLRLNHIQPVAVFYLDHNGLVDKAGRRSPEILADPLRADIRVNKLGTEPAAPGRLKLPKSFPHLDLAVQAGQIRSRVFQLVKGDNLNVLLQVVQQLLGALGQAELIGGGNIDALVVAKGYEVDGDNDAQKGGQHYQGVDAVAAGAADKGGHYGTEENQPHQQD